MNKAMFLLEKHGFVNERASKTNTEMVKTILS